MTDMQDDVGNQMSQIRKDTGEDMMLVQRVGCHRRAPSCLGTAGRGTEIDAVAMMPRHGGFAAASQNAARHRQRYGPSQTGLLKVTSSPCS